MKEVFFSIQVTMVIRGYRIKGIAYFTRNGISFSYVSNRKMDWRLNWKETTFEVSHKKSQPFLFFSSVKSEIVISDNHVTVPKIIVERRKQEEIISQIEGIIDKSKKSNNPVIELGEKQRYKSENLTKKVIEECDPNTFDSTNREVEIVNKITDDSEDQELEFKGESVTEKLEEKKDLCEISEESIPLYQRYHIDLELYGDTPITRLSISQRLTNILLRNGYQTIRAFLKLSEEDISAIKHSGKMTVNEAVMLAQLLAEGKEVTSAENIETSVANFEMRYCDRYGVDCEAYPACHVC